MKIECARDRCEASIEFDDVLLLHAAADGWIVVSVIGGLYGAHFCSWRHLAEYAAERHLARIQDNAKAADS